MENYEEIITRLEACVQELGKEVASLKAYFGVPAMRDGADGRPYVEKYVRLPDEAIDECYESAKISVNENRLKSVIDNHRIGNKYGAKVDKVRRYIFVAMQLIKGEPLNVGLRVEILRKYVQRIYEDYGKDGVRNALTSIRAYIDNHRSSKRPSYKHILLCEEIEREYEL